ncbi:MAG: DUF3817 domain-containing protein [Myxococcales bacterium]|nr:DUF3817 domain-containing protein [Myxococcales bacterium]
MEDLSASWLRWFRLVARAEGASFVLLLGVAMPLKYFAGMPLAVRVIGMCHGLLFVAYSWMLIDAASRGWPKARAAWGFVAGLLPFGTFVFEARLRRAGNGWNE